MKKASSILLLLIILVQCTGSFSIWVAFKINQQYIADNLCINRFEAIPVCKGSCVLEKEVNKQDEQQQKLPELKVKEVQLYCHQSQVKLWTKEIYVLVTYPLPTNTAFASQQYSTTLIKPPSLLS